MSRDKQPFLVVLDHMKAGYWGVMNARSESEIKAKWPELKIIRQRPHWMTQQEYDGYLGHPYDVNDAPHGILDIIAESRGAQ
jgi:hypothetical protein